jgi:aspartate carbamoyltransferase catalytic subunit
MVFDAAIELLPSSAAPARSYPAGGLAYPHRDLTGIGHLARHEILYLLDEAEQWVELNRQSNKRADLLPA